MCKKIQLRDYQQKSLDMLYDWFNKNPIGHPVVNMPGGSGKSVVIASLVKEALQNWPTTRILMLVHVKELIVQNSDKLRKIWPNAPMGIYSASIGRRQLGEPITYAGIGSVAKRAQQLGHIDLCIIDEVHTVSTTESGQYRKLIADLLEINPNMRIIGFSASPYRLGHGMITEGKAAIFSDIIEPVTIEELVYQGYLSPLRSKITHHKLNTDGLHKRQGEFIASEMEAKFNTNDNNVAVAQEIIEKASDRKHWLLFCSGREHAEAMAECLRNMGITAESLDATHKKPERERKLADFESGKMRAICSIGILSTGYDFPALDCIVFLRGTASPGLYLQCAVRGMRIHPEKEDCLVLDFTGVVAAHGPVTAVQPPKMAGGGTGTAPVKVCEECGEICAISARECTACGTPFPPPEAKVFSLHDDDIMGLNGIEMEVTTWVWRKHVSRSSGKEMLSCTYYGGLSDKPITEYLTVLHEGYAGEKSRRMLLMLANKSQVDLSDVAMKADNHDDLEFLAGRMNEGNPPSTIEYKRDGKFFRVIKRIFSHE